MLGSRFSAKKPLPAVDTVDGEGDEKHVVYVDMDGSGPETPAVYTAQKPHAFLIKVAGRSFIHTHTRPDGAWVYGPQ